MKQFLIIFLSSWFFCLSAQNQIEGIDALAFSIKTDNDTIEYLKIGADIDTPKPTIIFLQGSLPSPLIIDLDSFKHINIPFDFKNLIIDYHLVIISMPKTPLIIAKEYLNKSYSFITNQSDEYSFFDEYLKNNYLDNYVNRTNAVIKDLRLKKWVNKDEIHLIGHSQGAKIATVVASENQQIKSVSLLGFNAFGRYETKLRRERIKLKSNIIEAKEYKANIKNLYERWEDINNTPNDFKKGHNSWASFSIDYTPFLLKIDIPIYIGYGTNDIIAENCDLLPLKFIEESKRNLTLFPYVGLDHNFFNVEREKFWDNVMGDIINWVELEK